MTGLQPGVRWTGGPELITRSDIALDWVLAASGHSGRVLVPELAVPGAQAAGRTVKHADRSATTAIVWIVDQQIGGSAVSGVENLQPAEAELFPGLGHTDDAGSPLGPDLQSGLTQAAAGSVQDIDVARADAAGFGAAVVGLVVRRGDGQVEVAVPIEVPGGQPGAEAVALRDCLVAIPWPLGGQGPVLPAAGGWAVGRSGHDQHGARAWSGFAFLPIEAAFGIADRDVAEAVLVEVGDDQRVAERVAQLSLLRPQRSVAIGAEERRRSG